MKQWLEGRGSVICPAPQGQQDGRVDDELDEPCQDDAMKGDVAEDSGAMPKERRTVHMKRGNIVKSGGMQLHSWRCKHSLMHSTKRRGWKTR